MKKMHYFHLSNDMVGVNLLANMAGSFAAEILTRAMIPGAILTSAKALRVADHLFTPAAILFIVVAMVWYERPIRRSLKALRDNTSISDDDWPKAQRRLLNEPFFVIIINCLCWFVGAIVYGLAVKISTGTPGMAGFTVMQSLVTGCITITIAFFWIEHILQRKMAPIFFPHGNLYATQGTYRIRIGTRLVALIFAGSIVPLGAIHMTIHGSTRALERGAATPLQILERLQDILLTETFVFMAFAVWLTWLVAVNFKRPLREIINVLQDVSRGIFDRKVRVTSNDEIGYTGDVINQMTEGLKEREQMRISLQLAQEVQQNLLPKQDLSSDGFQIAGKSIYCDETGGDYYDFICLDHSRKPRICVAIGDVSGHGIPSALLMASVRSSLRQRISLPGNAAGIITDVNRQLVRDLEDSGQFMTLFYLSIEPEHRQMEWVRAGHDPAFSYDPVTETFEMLHGPGIALGVDENWMYEGNKKTSISKGHIILLGTDGIWEARNRQGNMFGKQPIYEIIRKQASQSAKEILEEILCELETFQQGIKTEDDITLVVIKNSEA